MQGVKKNMGLFSVLLSALFLFNPIYGFRDMLPNCIGYLLLWTGLGALGDLNDSIFESAQRFRILFWADIGVVLAQFLLHGILAQKIEEMNVYEYPMLILLFTSLQFLLHLLVLIPAFRKLFAGMDWLAVKHGSEALSAEKHGKSRSERMGILTTVFVAVSSVAMLLPELTVLASFEYERENPLFSFDWYNYVDLLRFVASAVSLLVGFVWLFFYYRYFKVALHDRDWLDSLCTEYRVKVLPKHKMLTMRTFSTAFLLLRVGAVFLIKLRINHHSVLPGVICAFLVAIAVLMLGQSIRERKSCVCAAVALGGISLLQLSVETEYLTSAIPKDSLYLTDAYWKYWNVQLLEAAEEVFIVVLVAILCCALRGLLQTQLNVDYGDRSPSGPSARATKQLQIEFEKKLLLRFLLFVLAAVVRLFDAFWRLSYPWLSPVSFAVSVLAVWQFSVFLQELLEQIGNSIPEDRE